MNIELTAQEYRDLLDILHIADMIVSGHRRGGDKRTEGHRALIQKLYAGAGNEGFDGLVSHNRILNKYETTEDFEQSTPAHGLVNEFSEHLFWDQLISRLTIRDAAQLTGGAERLGSMSNSDRRHVEEPIRQRYVQEFSANGVANLEVIERFTAVEGMPMQTSD
jgi:hypothetical protein